MEIYKISAFAKWAKKVGISDCDLLEVIHEMNRGLVGDRLGAYIFKKRIKIDSRGKSSGARSIVAYQKDDLAFFLYGFTKNEKDNLTDSEEELFRTYAKELMGLNFKQRESLVIKGELLKVEEQ